MIGTTGFILKRRNGLSGNGDATENLFPDSGAEIRLMRPIEFHGWLDRAGFEVLAVAEDDAETNLDGQRLWVVLGGAIRSQDEAFAERFPPPGGKKDRPQSPKSGNRCRDVLFEAVASRTCEQLNSGRP
ncbi:hypothetical protein [Phyllobacterium sophorae]|uniref:Uncharacterized protein n=1 Tax=Phyllobacterium sophorae TaxID=1520277 RepID=A0A2P7AQJ4_9HYPH|nr:hypothetical protein [Phyllobacterium sophorae]PSH56495.1 hypothetical protein CU103_29250 [Phyllobacterium sophorae]